MNKEYKKLLYKILTEGYRYEDPRRKGVSRFQISHHLLKHNMKNGFPFITLRETYPTLALKELELFMKGETNIEEFRKLGVNFWDKDLDRYNKSHGTSSKHLVGTYPEYLVGWNGKVNQIENLIDTLKNNPMSTKKTVTMWSPKTETVLTPCHWSFEVLVEPLTLTGRINLMAEKYDLSTRNLSWSKLTILVEQYNIPHYRMSLKWHQHSVDVYLGLPMNVAYYAGLLVWLSSVTDMEPHILYGDLSNVHIYDNAYENSTELAYNTPHKQKKVKVTYEGDRSLMYPIYSNFKWDKNKVIMGKKLPVEMLTYSN